MNKAEIRLPAALIAASRDAPESPLSPERALALALLHRAMTDAVEENGPDARLARAFFTKTTGAWAETRAFWCAVAGVEESWLLKHAPFWRASGAAKPGVKENRRTKPSAKRRKRA